MKIAICDDQEILRNQLIQNIRLYGDENDIFEYKNGEELLAAKESFDVIFLDIEMPELDGMEVAEIIRARGDEVRIIFLTSHLECIYDAFKVKAYRFLNKPIDIKVLEETMKEIQAEILNTEKIIINQKNNVHVINVKSIVYLEAYGDGTYIHDNRGNAYDSSLQLKEWEKRLQGKNFFKPHKSYIVSLHYVRGIEGNKVKLENVCEMPIVARRNIASLKEAYLQYMKDNARVI